MPSMLVSKLPLMLPTVFGGINVLLATLTLETCNLSDEATLIGKRFPAILRMSLARTSTKPGAFKKSTPNRQILLLEQHRLCDHQMQMEHYAPSY